MKVLAGIGIAVAALTGTFLTVVMIKNMSAKKAG